MRRDYALFTDDAARILRAWTNGEVQLPHAGLAQVGVLVGF